MIPGLQPLIWLPLHTPVAKRIAAPWLEELATLPPTRSGDPHLPH